MHFFTFKLSPAGAATVPVAMAFFLAAALILLLNLPELSIAFFLGLIAGGLVDMDSHTSGRLRNVAVMLLGFALSSIAVAATSNHIILRPLVMSAIAFISIWFGAVDQRYRTLGFGVLTVAIYTTLTEQTSAPWQISALTMLSGAILYHGMSLFFHLLFPNRPVQDALIHSYRTLGEIFISKAHYFDPDENAVMPEWRKKLNQAQRTLTAHFNACRAALFIRLSRYTQREKTQQQLQYYFIAQDLHERINSSHVDYAELIEKWPHHSILWRIKELILLQGQACQNIATSLQNAAALPSAARRERKTNGLKRALQSVSDSDLTQLSKNLFAINEQLEKLEKIQQRAQNAQPSELDTRIAAPAPYSLKQALSALKRHFSVRSSYFRHALRIAMVTFPLSLVIEYWHLPLGYWILLTVIFVCQPNYAATQQKIRQRIAGTLIGVLIGSLLPLLIPSLSAKLILIALSCVLFFYYRVQNYGYSTFFITVQVFLGLSIIGIQTAEVAPARIIDTLIGAGVSYVAVTFLFPDRRYQSIENSLAGALIAASDYLHVYVDSRRKPRDNLPYRAARRRLYEAAAELSEYSANLSAQPETSATEREKAQQLTEGYYHLLADLSSLGADRREDLPYVAEQTIYFLSESLFELKKDSSEQIARRNATFTQLLATFPDDPNFYGIKKQLSRIHKRKNELFELIHAEEKNS